eukprot:PhF_6_TR39119/c0_g1_i1/m.58549
MLNNFSLPCITVTDGKRPSDDDSSSMTGIIPIDLVVYPLVLAYVLFSVLYCCKTNKYSSLNFKKLLGRPVSNANRCRLCFVLFVFVLLQPDPYVVPPNDDVELTSQHTTTARKLQSATAALLYPEKIPYTPPRNMAEWNTNHQYRCVRPIVYNVEAWNTFPLIGPLLKDIGLKYGKNPAYFDIGSNDGQEVGIYMDMLHGCTHCHIVSIEPNANYRKDILGHVYKHLQPKSCAVTLCSGAVTNERNPNADSEELYLVGQGPLAHIVPKREAREHADRRRVLNIRLSRLIETMKFDRIVAVKVDTEGYDGTILWSLVDLWKKLRPDFILYELNVMLTRFPTHPSTLAKSFNEIGYKSFVAGIWIEPSQKWMPKEEQQPVMLLFEMTPKRWLGATEAVRFESGILLPEDGLVLRNFTLVDQTSNPAEQ